MTIIRTGQAGNRAATMEQTTDTLIITIRAKLKLLSWVVVLIISTVLLLNMRILSSILDYIPSVSMAILLIIVSVLVLIGFYISRKVSLHAINSLNGLVVSLQNEIAERKRLEEELKILATTDELTGLHNRRGFLTLAAHQLRIAKREKKALCLIYADLDNLKTVNDEAGHEAGDTLIRDTAGVLKATFRESDLLARVGGDEFVIFPAIGLSDVNSERMVARLQENIESYNAVNTSGFSLSLSVGVSFAEQGYAGSVQELLSKADKLMYEQKRKKKER
ncbi:MAG: hypothetical protein C0402_04220 [Thermodesulfovibrio sp.]|nr:hypothetical protein [Thermodesulfovibrio sp.]